MMQRRLPGEPFSQEPPTFGPPVLPQLFDELGSPIHLRAVIELAIEGDAGDLDGADGWVGGAGFFTDAKISSSENVFPGAGAVTGGDAGLITGAGFGADDALATGDVGEVAGRFSPRAGPETGAPGAGRGD